MSKIEIGDRSAPETTRLPADFLAEQHPALQAYAELLTRWNARFNMVGRNDMGNLWSRHINDALFLYQCLPEPAARDTQWVLDVGTGAGLPGMVLAILAADPAIEPASLRRFVLLDRSERKVRFLAQVVAELELAHVVPLCADFTQPIAAQSSAVMHDGASDQLPDRFDVICARAVAPPDALWADVSHALSPTGSLLVACGPQTRAQLPADVQVEWVPDGTAKTNTSERGAIRLWRDRN